MYALDYAMGELTYALKTDPIALRRANDTMEDPASAQPLHEPTPCRAPGVPSNRWGGARTFVREAGDPLSAQTPTFKPLVRIRKRGPTA